MPPPTDRTHSYHAEASVLFGSLKLPLVQQIQTQAYAKLPEEGGYLAQHEEDYRLESVISFSKAYTQVAGNPGIKPGHGWSTLATAVVEGLNVLDIVTADRIVAQISVDHPEVGYVPMITFLGTRFEGLKIAGHLVDCDFDFDLFGEKPENDAPYTKSQSFLDKVERQHGNVQAHPNLLKELIERYTGFSRAEAEPKAVECSLVNQAKGSFPGLCHGHVIHVPDFGTVCLANARLEESDYEKGTPKRTEVHLTMLEMHMGCVAAGKAGVGSGKTNGMSQP